MTDIWQSYSLFLPSIIKALGYSSVKAQLFTVAPNMCSFFIVLATAAYSDRIKARGPFMIAGCLVAIAGYAMMLGAEKSSVRYGGTFLVASGVFQGSPMVCHARHHPVHRTDSSGYGLAFKQYRSSFCSSNGNRLRDRLRELRCIRRYLHLPL